MSKYRVIVSGLRYPTDVRVIKRLLAGEDVPWAERRMCEPHKVGDIIDDMPQACVKGLINARWIEEVQE